VGRAYDELGQLEAAVAEFDRALEILSRTTRRGGSLTGGLCGNTLDQGGLLQAAYGRPERAVAEYGSAIAVLEEMDRAGYYVDQYDLVRLYFDRGAVVLTRGT
jgi:tetratricopeptide (TPR) repeat protein